MRSYKKTNTPGSKIGRLESKNPRKYPPLTSISGISEPHQSELYQLPTDLPVAKDGRKTSSLHQSPIFCFHAPVFNLSAARSKHISQERLAKNTNSPDFLQMKIEKSCETSLWVASVTPETLFAQPFKERSGWQI